MLKSNMIHKDINDPASLRNQQAEEVFPALETPLA